jgi:hypothetical protein
MRENSKTNSNRLLFRIFSFSLIVAMSFKYSALLFILVAFVHFGAQSEEVGEIPGLKIVIPSGGLNFDGDSFGALSDGNLLTILYFVFIQCLDDDELLVTTIAVPTPMRSFEANLSNVVNIFELRR